MGGLALRLWLCSAAAAFKPLDMDKPCNGDPALCDLRVSQVTFSGSHNADSVGLWLKGFKAGCLTDNHAFLSSQELKDGLRFLDFDTCLTGSEIQICHVPAKGRMAKGDFEELNDFMVKNPREVVVLSFINAKPGNYEHARVLLKLMTDVFGSLLWMPNAPHGILEGKWPKLSELIEANTRIVVLWGKRLFASIYFQQKGTAEKDGQKKIYEAQYISMEFMTAPTYNGKYKKWKPYELAETMKDFCPREKENDKSRKPPRYFKRGEGTSLVVADVYLTATRRPISISSICIKDLSADVNSIFYNDVDLTSNPLMQMQQNCWDVEKHVFIVSGDYVEYFPKHLQTIGRALNDMNFAKYGWIGGSLKLTSSNTATSEAELKDLIKKLAGLTDTSRISIEKSSVAKSEAYRRLAGGGGEVEFSISAPEDNPIGQISNTQALEAMRTAASSEAGVDKVVSTCRDPGTPPHSTRNPSNVVAFFEEGATITFTCDEKKPAVHGSTTRTCGKDGIFSGIQPHCRGEWTLKDPKWPWYIHAMVWTGLVLVICCCCGGCIFGCTLLYSHSRKKSESSGPAYSVVQQQS